ncbi:MAG: hypothetical protein LBI13_06970, partial [Streptococcaceae bacterium]|nr:hypothetical protein [Streptococcaceae bacterium]
ITFSQVYDFTSYLSRLFHQNLKNFLLPPFTYADIHNHFYSTELKIRYEMPQKVKSPNLFGGLAFFGRYSFELISLFQFCLSICPAL